MSHLMDNACEVYSRWLYEFSYIREDDKIVFTIKDTGIGIKNENIVHIFEEFRQEVGGHHRPFEGLVLD